MKPMQWISVLVLFFAASIVNAQVCPGIAGSINLLGPVSGAPFTADYVHVFEEKRGDSLSHQEAHGKLYRDSEGRARCDVEIGKTGKTKFVIISDPVAGIAIRMNVEQQTARVTHYPRSRDSAPFAPATPPQNPDVKPTVNSQSQGSTHTEEDLGSKTIEGFPVTGKRSTNTKDGSANTTAEDWYSADLKFQLLYSWDNPNTSKIRDQIINVRSGNPDASVFHVPEGYTVKDLYCRGNSCGYDSE